MIGFKGFDKDLKCSPNGSVQQYEVGKTVEFPETKLCGKGGHFCEDPFDVWKYYPILDNDGNLNRFGQVEAEDISPDRDGDSKRVAKRLTVKVELSIKAMIEAGLKFFFEKAEFSEQIEKSKKWGDTPTAASGNDAQLAASGYAAQLAASGYAAQLAASGNAAKLAASGNAAKLAASGNDAQLAASGNDANLESAGARGIVAGIGVNNQARGTVGCWLVLAEYEQTDEGPRVKDVKTKKIDGKKIKAGTWYQLKGGKFVEVK